MAKGGGKPKNAPSVEKDIIIGEKRQQNEVPDILPMNKRQTCSRHEEKRAYVIA